MTLAELLEMLDLDEAAEFEYFENISDLVESDEEIEMEIIYQLFKDIDMEVMADLLGTYFDDILEAVPQEAVEVYSLLESIKMVLTGMAKNIDEDGDVVRFSDEFTRFRTWYSQESAVWIREIGAADGDRCVNMRDALTFSRCEELGGEKYEYTFDEAIDYEMDDYSMNFADLLREEETGYDQDYEDLGDVDIPGIEYTDHIFTPDENLN